MKPMAVFVPFRLVIVCGMLLVSLALLSLQPALAAVNDNPGILPPQSKPYGMTYGAWGAQWWKWVIGIPAAENPAYSDETGEFGNVDQAGPVWFLAGNGGGTTVRTLDVPAGKALFFPILTTFWGCPSPDERAFLEATAIALGMDPDDVAALKDVPLERLVIGAQMDSVASMSCTIDGVAVQHLKLYRAPSPVFTLTDLDLVGGGGLCGDAVADGYWLMVAPLSAGEHTIHFSGAIPADAPLGSFELDVTYHLTVK
jgi:hypothetical protein